MAEEEEEILIATKFRLGRKIAVRSNTDFFLGTDVETNEDVLIKRENANARHPHLRGEYMMTEFLTRRVAVGIPTLRAFRAVGDYNYFVTSLLGPSLEDLLKVCKKRRFSLKTVLMLAFQMIDRVEFIHDHNFLHRDISPENFLMGVGEAENLVYINGFRLCKSFRHCCTGKHIPFRKYLSPVGAERYASAYTLAGFEHGRRDDIESIGYILMYFLRGRLPWQGTKAEDVRERRKKICEKKSSIEVFCKGYPPEFASYFYYCRSLMFEEKPDYSHLKSIFHGLFIREGFQNDYAFDWKKKRAKKTAPRLETVLEED